MLIPERWVTTLDRLHRGGFPEAVIAGGALRDLDHDVDIKDVDIFINHKHLNTKILLDTAFGYEGTVVVGEAQARYTEALKDVEAIYEYASPNGGPPFQVISLFTDHFSPEVVMERIDFGLCRIAYDGHALIYHDNYRADCISKTFTLLRCGSPEELKRSDARFIRLTASKYAGYTLVIPEDVVPLSTVFATRP